MPGSAQQCDAPAALVGTQIGLQPVHERITDTERFHPGVGRRHFLIEGIPSRQYPRYRRCVRPALRPGTPSRLSGRLNPKISPYSRCLAHLQPDTAAWAHEPAERILELLTVFLEPQQVIEAGVAEVAEILRFFYLGQQVQLLAFVDASNCLAAAAEISSAWGPATEQFVVDVVANSSRGR